MSQLKQRLITEQDYEENQFRTPLSAGDFRPGCFWKAEDRYMQAYQNPITSRARLIGRLCPVDSCKACDKMLKVFDTYVMMKLRHHMWEDEHRESVYLELRRAGILADESMKLVALAVLKYLAIASDGYFDYILQEEDSRQEEMLFANFE
jgi:hypothetical protein